MNFLGLAFLLVAHYLCGRGIMRMFKVSMSPVRSFCIAMMIGVAALSFVPCFLQLMSIPITAFNNAIGVIVQTSWLSAPLLIKFKRPRLRLPMPALYEWPFIIVIGFLLFISVWRCFYYPPTPRDMITGPELLAEYAVREQNMISSVFSIDLHTTNNHLKSPFITGLQILYKLFVSPFGQLWLSVLFVSFITLLYSIARQRLHPVMAGLLILFFVTIPDLYAYSFLILYDYSNMVFFFCGFYFLGNFIKNDDRGSLLFSAFLFGIATYIRTETLILVAMVAPVVVFHFVKTRTKFLKAAMYCSIFLMVPVLFYLICNNIFVPYFVPVPFDVAGYMNQHLEDVSVFFRRLKDIHTELLFSIELIKLYGFIPWVFCAVLLTDIIWPRRFNREGVLALYGVAVVVIGLAFIGYLLPSADLVNTTKRGVCKAFPLMLLYFMNSGVLQHFSALIKKWEHTGGRPVTIEIK